MEFFNKKDKKILELIKRRFDTVKPNYKGKKEVPIGILNGEFEALGISEEGTEESLSLFKSKGIIYNLEYNEDQTYKHPTAGWVNYFEIPNLYPGDWTFTVNSNFDKKFNQYLNEFEKKIKSSNEGRITIYLSKLGLSTREEEVEYKFTGYGYKTLIELVNFGDLLACDNILKHIDCTNMGTLSHAKNELNKKFKNKLDLDDDLIIHIDKRGYKINDKYRIVKTF